MDAQTSLVVVSFGERKTPSITVSFFLYLMIRELGIRTLKFYPDTTKWHRATKLCRSASLALHPDCAYLQVLVFPTICTEITMCFSISIAGSRDKSIFC